jgi:hypothetical protein
VPVSGASAAAALDGVTVVTDASSTWGGPSNEAPPVVSVVGTVDVVVVSGSVVAVVSVVGTVVDVLVAKTIKAAHMAGRKLITVSGGVSCNGELRRQMSLGAERAGLELRFAAPTLCTDNAAMIGFAAQLHLERGEFTPLPTEIPRASRLGHAPAPSRASIVPVPR